MSRLFLTAAVAALLAAGAAQAQRVDIDPARATSYEKPIPARPGELIASAISDGDFRVGPDYYAEHFVFTGRAGETVSAQVKSGIPTLDVLFREKGYNGKTLARGPAKDSALTAVLPKDGDYYLVVAAKGPQRQGQYLLSFGVDGRAPPLEPPKPAPVQVAGAEPSTSKAAPPAKPAAPKPAPAAPPPMPVIPGVTNLRVGQTLARPPGKPGAKVELYAFAGEAGSILKATAEGAGGYGVTLYTPEGAEMLAANGLGAARLDAVLPKDAIYLLAVSRQDAAKPFKLSLAAERPDDLMWSFRSYAGYETLNASGALVYWTCWVVPGSVLQYQMADGSVQRLTTHAGGAGRWELPSGGYSFTTRIEGAKVIRTSEAGTVQTWSLDAPPRAHGAYRGYLCR